MKSVAVILTVFNRIEKTCNCLFSLFDALNGIERLNVDIFLTDDGSADDTANILKKTFPTEHLYILHGNGNLYWNGGMNNSWRAALEHGGYDGYLWLNNDTVLLPCLWKELIAADEYSKKTFGHGGIYIGSTYDKETRKLTYGGFNFVNRWTLKDRFLIPNGSFQSCQCGHGNITYVANNVVDKMGMLYDGYIHGGGDHDYTYLAYKKGFPVFILRKYVGICENDHKQDGYGKFFNMGLIDRIKFLNSPTGYNLHNTLVFQRRCFPYRYPFVFALGYLKAIFPRLYLGVYRTMRR